MNEKSGRPMAAELNNPRPVRNRIMLTAALSLLLGIFLAPHSQSGGWPWLLLAAGLLAGTLPRLPGQRNAALALCFCAVGLLWAQVWLHPAAPEEGVYTIRGRVYGEATVRSPERMTFLLGDVTLDGQPQGQKAYCSLYVYGEPLPTLFDGAELSFAGRVYHPQGKSRPHDFDFRMWMYQNRLPYGISSIKDLQILNSAETAPWYDASARVRIAMRAALTQVMGEEARLAMAMLVNDREGIAQDEYEAFQKTGIAHVMSVSGLHVGIIGGLLYALLKKLRLRQRLQLPVMAVFLLAYCMLTGFSAAAVRAAVMALLVAGARAANRTPDPLLTLSTAVVLVLLLNPLQLFSAGFVLSFSAMAGILLLYPRFLEWTGRGRRVAYLRRAWERRNPGSVAGQRLKRTLGDPLELLAVSLAAQLGVLLPTATYFHQLPLYGLAINLLIVPLVGLLIPLYMITLALSPIPYLGLVPGWIAQQGSALLLALVKLLAELPYAVIRVPSAPMAVGCGAALCGVLVSWYFRGRKGLRLSALALTLLLALGCAFISRPADLRYIQLSVGQADAALLMDGSTTIAVDAGESGEATASYLLAEGRNLDAVFVTHLHQDHALGLMDVLDNGISIGVVYLPLGGTEQLIDKSAAALLERLTADGIPLVELAAGDEVRYNRIAFSVLWPRPGGVRRMQDANQTPLVLNIDFNGYSIFSASDLLADYEAYTAAPCDVLKVAHHGSANGTGGAFLDFAAPQAALVSCGAGGALPAPETLARLSARGIPQYRTNETGDITLTIREGRLLLTTYKARKQE